MLKVYTEAINVEIKVPSAESLQATNVEIKVPSAEILPAANADGLRATSAEILQAINV